MRHIHPVGVSETFVASGKYDHYINSKPTGTYETWSIHELPDGGRIIRVDMDGRAIDGRSTLIEAWTDPTTGDIQRFDVWAYGRNDDAIQQARASYNCFPDHVEVGRSLDKQERIYEEMPLPEGYIAYPGALIFLGFAVVKTAAARGKRPILTYDPQLDDTTALRAETYNQSATMIGEETLQLGNKTYAARRFERLFPFYDVLLPHLWIDAHDTLLQHDAPQSSSYSVLTNYARRPEKK